jgi:hypothetical protein
MLELTIGDTDLLCGHFNFKTLGVEQDVLFDPIQIRFLLLVSVILQPPLFADLIKESFIRWKYGSLLDQQAYIFF